MVELEFQGQQRQISTINNNHRGKSYLIGDVLLQTFFLFCLIPFVSPFPLSTDTQPVFAIIGYFTLIYFFYKRSLKINYFTIVFFMFAVAFMLNYNFQQPNGVLYHIRKSVGLLLTVPIIILFSKYLNLLSFRLVLAVIVIYLLGAIIQVFLPSVYYGFFSHFFNNKAVELGLRGWKSFSAEPINLSFTCIAIICLAIASHQIAVFTNTQKNIIIFLCVFLVLGSFSATGSIALVIIGGVAIVNKINIKLILGLIFFVIAPLILNYEYLYASIRGFRLLIDIVVNPLAIIEKTSLFYRVFHNIIAFLYFIDQPTLLGLGVASFDEAAKHVVDVYNLANYFPFRAEFITDGYHSTFGNESKNMISQLIIEHGLLGILFYLLCLFYIIKYWSKNMSIYILTYFIIASIQSTPMLFPLTWVLLASNHFVYRYKLMMKRTVLC